MSINFITKRPFHHQVQFFRLLSDRINFLVFQSLILSVVLRPSLKSETQAPLLPEPFHFSPLLLTNLPICQFVLPVVLRLPVWLAPTYVADTVLPLFLPRYTPFFTVHTLPKFQTLAKLKTPNSLFLTSIISLI